MSRRFFKVSFTSFILLFTSLAFAATANLQPRHFSQRPDVHKFISMMVQKYHFNEKELNKLFDKVIIQQKILETMAKPAETWPWYKYQAFFITQDRINGGVEFWNKHMQTLKEVEAKDGVPADVIVAIIGVETFYGKNQGNYRVLDSLATLAFNYPKRKDFFQEELKEYLLLARDNQFDPTNMLGSYAGAIGQGQFMPSSYRIYAIDYRKTGVKDLRNDTDDVIASIGNYLKQHGWDRDQPIAVKAQINGDTYKKLTADKLKPNYTVSYLKTMGVTPLAGSYSSTTKANFMCLDGKTASEPWLGFYNFYVISTYNPRINYTMAVYQLSDAIRQARKV